jgi:hypothetical protein
MFRKTISHCTRYLEALPRGHSLKENGVKIDESFGGYSKTTRKRMYVLGIAEALRRLWKIKKEEPCDIFIYMCQGVNYINAIMAGKGYEKWKMTGNLKIKDVEILMQMDKVYGTGSNISIVHSTKSTVPELIIAQKLSHKMSLVNLPAYSKPKMIE